MNFRSPSRRELMVGLAAAIAAPAFAQSDKVIRVIRKADKRIVAIDSSKLMTGDMGQNIVIRAGDMIIVTPPGTPALGGHESDTLRIYRIVCP